MVAAEVAAVPVEAERGQVPSVAVVMEAEALVVVAREGAGMAKAGMAVQSEQAVEGMERPRQVQEGG